MEWKEAVELAKNGDNRGYDYLYTQTCNKNYYLALKYMEDEELAKDVLQESYIKAFNKLEQLKDANKFPGWMSRIVANMAIDVLRKKKRNDNKLFSEMESDDSEDMTFEEKIEDDRRDNRPELAIDQKETGRLVKEIIDTLSEEQRLCVMMYYINGMSVKEIADMADVSENTIKSRLNYGRKKIEQKVLELEKRGTKLYGIAPVPFFLYLLLKDADSVKAAPVLAEDIINKISQGSHAAPKNSIEDNTSVHAVNEAVEETTKETAKETVGETTKEAAKEAVEETIKEVTKEAAKETIKETAGNIAGKAAAFSVKKIVIGIVAGLAVAGGAAAVVSGVNHKDDNVYKTDNIQDNSDNNQNGDVITAAEQETTQDMSQENWKNAIIECYNELEESSTEGGNGYALMKTGEDKTPTLVVAKGIFNHKIDGSRWRETPFKSEQEYVDAMTKTATVKFLSDDKCVVRGICEMELYTSDKTGKKAVKLEADSLMTETGDYVLMYGMPYYYLTYIPEKKELVVDLVGSTDVLGAYTIQDEKNKISQVGVYTSEYDDMAYRKDIVYYRSIEEALNNINTVVERELK